jgi:hypothetical protein
MLAPLLSQIVVVTSPQSGSVGHGERLFSACEFSDTSPRLVYSARVSEKNVIPAFASTKDLVDNNTLYYFVNENLLGP